MTYLKIVRSKTQSPCLWEQGGSATNTGSATIIADAEGGAKKPIYIAQRGHLSNGDHALIPVSVGDHIITANHWRGDFEVEIYRIRAIGADDKIEIELITEFSNGEWDKEPPTTLQAAVDAAKAKATCYHCREPHYIK